MKYKVYVLPDKNKCVIDVQSTAFYNEADLLKKGYLKIDEGEDVEIYGYAQQNYFIHKYKKPLCDNQYLPNFKLEQGAIIILSNFAKQELCQQNINEPTEQDRINADIYLQLATLQQSSLTLLVEKPSLRFAQIQKYYTLNLYSIQDLEIFVSANWITALEKEQIINNRKEERDGIKYSRSFRGGTRIRKNRL